MAETPSLELVDIQPIILKLEGPFFSVRVHTRDAQYPEIDPSPVEDLGCGSRDLFQSGVIAEVAAGEI